MSEIELLKGKIKELEAELAEIKSSPYVKTYMAFKNQLETWADELESKPVSLTANNEESDQRAFDKADKYMKSLGDYLTNLEMLRQKMTPQEIKEAESTSDVDEARKLLKKHGKI